MRIDIDEVVKESGIQEPPRTYINRAFKISGYSALSLSSLSILYFINPFFILFIPISIIAFSLIFSSFLVYPYITIKIGGKRISTRLLDIYGIIYSLSSSDIDYIFTVLSESLDKDVSKPFRRYLYDRSILGLSVVDALRRAGERCPNKELRNTFNVLADSVSSSGSIKDVLKHFEKGIVERRSGLEKAVRSSMLIGEFYITFNILMPIIVIVMLVIFAIVGGSMFGVNPLVIIPLTIYLTPLVSIIFYLLSGD